MTINESMTPDKFEFLVPANNKDILCCETLTHDGNNKVKWSRASWRVAAHVISFMMCDWTTLFSLQISRLALLASPFDLLDQLSSASFVPAWHCCPGIGLFLPTM